MVQRVRYEYPKRDLQTKLQTFCRKRLYMGKNKAILHLLLFCVGDTFATEPGYTRYQSTSLCKYALILWLNDGILDCMTFFAAYASVILLLFLFLALCVTTHSPTDWSSTTAHNLENGFDPLLWHLLSQSRTIPGLVYQEQDVT